MAGCRASVAELPLLDVDELRASLGEFEVLDVRERFESRHGHGHGPGARRLPSGEAWSRLEDVPPAGRWR